MPEENKITEEDTFTKPTSKTLVANDCVFIQNGLIAGNPFVHRLDSSKTAQWMITHKKEVMKLIKYWIREFGLSNAGLNAEDCFAYSLTYFIENKSKEFRKSYFGKGTNYTIRNYLHVNLRFCIHNYIKQYIKNPDKNIIVSNNSSDFEKNNTRFKVIEDNLTKKEDVYENLFQDNYVELDKKFDELIEFEDYFTEKGYKNFDLLGYIAFMYFNVDNYNAENNSDLINSQIEYVAEKIGESKQLIQLITHDFKKDYYNKNPKAIRLLRKISSLVDSMKTGWKPDIIRENVEKEANKKREDVKKLWIQEQVQ